MNKYRRKRIASVIEAMDKLKDLKSKEEALELLHDSEKTLQAATNEEEVALDNLPENMQWSQRWDDFSDNVENLNDAQFELDAVIQVYDDSDDVPLYKSVRKHVKSVISNCTEAIER